MTVFIDSSALKSWGCRELYRQSFVENISPLKPNPAYEMGKAVHLAVEEFWKGSSYEQAMDAAYQLCNSITVQHFNPQESEHWRKQVESLPDLVAVYFDQVEYQPENLLWVEQEWSVPLDDKVTLCGRMDRVMLGPRLVDVKTASEITRMGIPWKKQYREEKLLDPQFGLYDWYLDSLGTPATECVLEVIVKPYKGSKARMEFIALPEILTEAYRRRFRQQLAWNCMEIAQYHEHYMNQRPWLMNPNMCNGKYGACPMFDRCVWGSIPRVEEKYGPRIEHLNVRRNQTGGNSSLRSSPALKEQ